MGYKLNSFDDLLNKETGKIGFVFGLGPSLKDGYPFLEQISIDDTKHTLISVNEWDKMTDLNCKYWVIANTQLTVGSLYDRMNSKQNTTLVYADSVDLTPRDQVESLLKINYLPYDQRHFEGHNCNLPPNHWHQCCKHRISNRLTIQEYLQKLSQNSEHYGSGNTGVLHALALSVILGCNPIFLGGMDLNYDKGFVNGQEGERYTFSDEIINQILRDIKIIKDSAKLLNIDIFTFNQNTPINRVLEYKNINNL